MIKYLLLIVLTLGTYSSLLADLCKIEIDLAGCTNDQVKVTVIPPTLSGNSTLYIMPRSVPGTYSKDDYGRFIVDVKAYDASGKALPVSRPDNDIAVEGKLAKLEYWVNDTWDDPQGGEVFQPTGSNFQKDTNYLLNTHCLIGYFVGYKMLPYEVTVIKPNGFFGATSLSKKEESSAKDVLIAKSYPHLVDNPIMYCIPDTTTFTESGTKVMVACYSPHKRITSAMVAKDLIPTAHSLGKFFGVMPVPNYTFIIYFAGMDMLQRHNVMGFGALEHSYSSCYFLPEGRGGEQTTEEIVHTASHEFLHILVPLNLHSEEIHSFDFKDPKMSKHLWLYEGCTEYFSDLARAQDTLLTEKEFFDEMNQKMKTTTMMTRGQPLSLVDLSTNVLTPENQKLYPIIYEKGAVAAFLLDLHIHELTNHRLDLLGMIRKLMEKYGPDKPFKDDELFEEITKITSPKIMDFFNEYIIGSKPLPYNEYFNKVGYSYKDSASVNVYQFASANIFFSRDNVEQSILRVRRENDFGAKDGDTLLQVNDVVITPANRIEEFTKNIWAPKTGNKVTLTVKRGSETVTLSATPVIGSKTVRNIIEQMPNPTAEQIDFRKKLFKKM
ncbi:MAG: hypothetical protein U0Y96_17115 [Candidatus Kapaibacterium sp.]